MNIKTPEVKALAFLCFPNFTGKTFKVEPVTPNPITLTSYWEGGSRDYHVIVNLETNQTQSIPENGTPYTYGGKAFVLPVLPMNFAIVTYHQGRCDYILIRMNPGNIRADMLPAPIELTWAEKVVLSATRSYKSSYAGIKNYRFHEAKSYTGILMPEWETAKASLIQKRLLNNAGAITDDGRNAIGRADLYILKTEKPI